MSQITGTRGYNSSFRGANSPSAFYAVFTGDFGEQIPAQPTLTYHANSGSIASSTTDVQLTWITSEGVTLPSAVKGVNVSAAGGAVTVAQPTVPTNGATVIGWQIYSNGSATTALDAAATSSTPAPQSIATTSGNVIGYPVATTSVLLQNWGAGAAVPAIDQSGIQAALPSVPAADTGTAGTADYYFVVPNSGSLWKNYKPVGVSRPDSVVETSGINTSYPFECQSPLYPGATAGTSTFTQVSVAPGTYMVMNGNAFISSQTGSQNIAAAFIGSAAFNVAKGATVMDGSVTWLCLGKATLVHVRFSNTNNTAEVPTAQEYDLFEI